MAVVSKSELDRWEAGRAGHGALLFQVSP